MSGDTTVNARMMVVQSDDITTVQAGGVPVLELPSSDYDTRRDIVLLRAVNFLRSGCSSVQLVMLYESSSTAQKFAKYKERARSFTKSIEIHEGREAELLECHFNEKDLILTLTRSVPPIK